MFESDSSDLAEVPGAASERAVAVLAQVQAGITTLLDTDLLSFDQADLLALVAGFEVQKRRIAAVEHRLIAELDDRHIAAELCVPNTVALLRGLLRIGRREATRRVRAAEILGARRTLTGQLLPPIFPAVADAQRSGLISGEHASVITRCVDQLPYAVQADYEDEVQASLLTHAATFDPDQLAKLAKRWADVLDPDGTLTADADHERRRDLSLSRNRDGSYTLTGRLTPMCGAIWAPILESVGQPTPASVDGSSDGVRDERTAGQRRADGFHDAGLLLLRTAELPRAGGAPVTLLVSITETQLRTGEGLATTGTGDLIPVRRILDLAGEAQTMTVRLDPHGGILDYGQSERIVPPQMRMAITARDRGCTFPGCDRTPSWTQAHHFLEFVADEGPTSIANCGLVCGYHHREFGRRGWIGTMINGRPYWTPPAWIDRLRRPLRNTLHDLVIC